MWSKGIWKNSSSSGVVLHLVTYLVVYQDGNKKKGSSVDGTNPIAMRVDDDL